jgi:carbonic anhydrase
MACTSPINIDTSTTDKCLLKCMYFFNYGSSSIRIENDTSLLIVHYDGGGDVVYNKQTYTPTQMQIYSPSLHTYDGQTAAAEIFIMHSPVAPAVGNLIVSVPILSDSRPTLSDGSNILSDIINYAPDINSTGPSGITSYTSADFNLNLFVPKAPYYQYDGTLPFPFCIPGYSYIVFDTKDSSLFLDSDTLSKLQSLINPADVTIYKAGKAYYNSGGTTSNGFDGDGQIYIDCQPTGEDGEILYSEDADGNALPLGGDSDYADEATEWVINSLYFVIGVVLMLIIVWAAKRWVFKKPDDKFAGIDFSGADNG